MRRPPSNISTGSSKKRTVFLPDREIQQFLVGAKIVGPGIGEESPARIQDDEMHRRLAQRDKM